MIEDRKVGINTRKDAKIMYGKSVKDAKMTCEKSVKGALIL